MKKCEMLTKVLHFVRDDRMWQICSVLLHAIKKSYRICWSNESLYAYVLKTIEPYIFDHTPFSEIFSKINYFLTLPDRGNELLFNF